MPNDEIKNAGVQYGYIKFGNKETNMFSDIHIEFKYYLFHLKVH